MEVTLPQMLFARERRAQEQQALLRQYQLPLISFTMNIAGPEKDTPLIRRGFQEGCGMMEEGLKREKIPVMHRQIRQEVTGCEAFYVVQGDPERIKSLCAKVEDSCQLGRLFDMDVLSPQGEQLRRQTVGRQERGCIVCGAPGRGCASRRVHTVQELQQATRCILTEHFQQRDRQEIGTLALRSLLDEVCTTPKPGLVDRENSGSHRDMDIFTFTASASALAPYFLQCAAIGQDTRTQLPEDTFRELRAAGIQAEQSMFSATAGVNTHKGAIFTLGTVCGAVGRLWTPEHPCRDLKRILEACAQMTKEAVEQDFAAMSASGEGVTVGQRLYLEHGLTGIRGEVAGGLPSVSEVGLPAFRQALAEGKSRNDAAAIALLHLIAKVTDTNMIARGGMELAREAMEQVGELLEQNPMPEPEQIRQLDKMFVQKNLSPGGCADLLAVTLFLHDWCNLDE